MKKAQAKRAGKGSAPHGKAQRKALESENAFFRPFEKLAAPKKSKNAAPSKPNPKSKSPAPNSKDTAKDIKTSASQSPAEHPNDHLQQSEMENFAVYMAGVRALDKRLAARVPKSLHAPEPEPQAKTGSAAPGAPKAPAPDLDAPARAAFRSLVAEGLRFESIDDGKHLEGRRIDTDPRELRKLRKGMYAIDGRLDLHGLSAAEARSAVTAFIRKRRSEGDRVIALIHGKGMHTPGGTGVLRGEIGAWLSDSVNARSVACFASAPDDMGGFGVLLVLLSR